MATAEATETTQEFDESTKELGDKLVGLTLLQARDLADYLKDVHGIAPFVKRPLIPPVSKSGAKAPIAWS